MSFLLPLLDNGFSAAAPLALAAVGGLFTEVAGSLSVALEGCMTLGAFAAAMAARASLALGGDAQLAALAALLAGLLAGLGLAALVGLAAERLGADVFVAGLAANLLAPGLASMLSSAFFGTKGVLRIAAGSAGRAVPSSGSAGLLSDPGFVLSSIAALILALLLGGTTLGLRLRAAGDKGEAAAAAGLDKKALRFLAHLVAGGAAGVAGAALAIRVAAWVPGMSAGRGWIALVAIYLGGRRAPGVLLASLAFGFLIALANAAQALSGLPAELILALPYVGTALVLVLGRPTRRGLSRDRA